VRRTRALTILLAATIAATLGLASIASARDPGRWLLTGASSVPNEYWQGLTSDPAEANLFFVGVFHGLWRTTPELRQTAGVSDEIPTGVTQREGYNHIGDPTWLGGEGGRVVLPMECFDPNDGNTCGTGAFGIADPETLAFRYYVKLDPAEIQKAMWAETSPSGRLIWTSSGDDLLAYRASDVSEANRAPAGPLLHPVRRLVEAVPPTGITGAVFRKHQLLLAGESNHVYQVWAVDTRTGDRKLKLEMHICGESEGLDVISTLGGRLHWLLSPADPDCNLTFGPTSALLHFVRRPARERYDVTITHLGEQTDSGSTQREITATVQVTRDGRYPVHGARVRFAGGKGRTSASGLATVSTTLDTPGRFSAYVRKGKRYGISNRVGIDIEPTLASAPAPPPDAGKGAVAVSAASRSSHRSSGCSHPTLTRTRPSGRCSSPG
jgi:hypothetical protein